jgi:hypothetical protein
VRNASTQAGGRRGVRAVSETAPHLAEKYASSLHEMRAVAPVAAQNNPRVHTDRWEERVHAGRWETQRARRLSAAAPNPDAPR